MTAQTTALSTFRLYLHTVRHLRPEQLYSRIRFKILRPRPRIPRVGRRRKDSGWTVPLERTASMTGEKTIRLLDQIIEIRADTWRDPQLAPLALYQLHYFDDLVARGAAARRDWHVDLIEQWIRENPPGTSPGWDPYPTSLRIVNWIKWALAGNELSPSATESLAIQIDWLSRRLEYHLLGNHLLANAKALVYGGAFLDGDDANRWVEVGLALLNREIPRQILADGGHFELSPMYHALILEDLLDLVNIACAFGFQLPSGVHNAIPPMFRWLEAMTHPDGEIAFFNDAAFGVAANVRSLAHYAERLGIAFDHREDSIAHLSASGYVRIMNERVVLIADVAEIGPTYLPAHGHADVLSFELSFDGERLIVNSGTSVYSEGEERLRQRGTAAHSTVIVDEMDSSEVWRSFRVARRARPQGIDVADHGHYTRVSGSHNGYLRLGGNLIHSREWVVSSKSVRIIDRLRGTYEVARAHYHLHPSIRVSSNGPSDGILDTGQGRQLQWKVKGGSAQVVESSYHPEFGKSIPSSKLIVDFESDTVEMEFTWSPT